MLLKTFSLEDIIRSVDINFLVIIYSVLTTRPSCLTLLKACGFVQKDSQSVLSITVSIIIVSSCTVYWRFRNWRLGILTGLGTLRRSFLTTIEAAILVYTMLPLHLVYLVFTPWRSVLSWNLMAGLHSQNEWKHNFPRKPLYLWNTQV